MLKSWFFLVVFALVIISVLILVIKKNHSDKKELFKKMPGDLSNPPMVKSEFDSLEKQK
jgi:amino acid transporter